VLYIYFEQKTSDSSGRSLKIRLPQRVMFLPIIIIALAVVVMLGYHFLSSARFVVLWAVSVGSFISYYVITYLRRSNPQLYFQKIGYKKGVTEYHYLRKIYYAVAGSLLFFLFLLFIPGLSVMQTNAIAVLAFGVLYPVFGCLWRRDRLLSDNDFYFFLAHACVKIISEDSETIQKMRYLILGIDFYDQYLRKNLRRHIRDVEEIYSRILSDSNLDRDKTIGVITEAFASNDKLRVVVCLSSILTDVKKEQFLVKDQFGRGLRDISPIIISVVTAVATIIGILIKVY
jgi:hypothetical protein